MSKFKIIDGQNVTSIASTDREIKQLEFEIQKKTDVTDRDLIVYSYHFVRLGHLLLAQKYLNRLSFDYFDVGVYKDLSQALLVWSMIQATPSLKNTPFAVTSEYFVIIKRAIQMFDDVNFTTRPAFYRFKKQFAQFTTAPSGS